MESILKAIAQLSSMVGLVAAWDQLSPKISSAGSIAIFVVVVLSFVAVGLEIRSFLKNRPTTFAPNSPDITRYMCKFLRSGGRAAIFSRDMSWAKNGDVGSVLSQKAQLAELTLVVGKEAPHIEQLMQDGANVYRYNTDQFTPQARFTIIEYEKMGATIAIGYRNTKNQHVIREYRVDDPAVVALASDLVKFAEYSLKNCNEH